MYLLDDQDVCLVAAAIGCLPDQGLVDGLNKLRRAGKIAPGDTIGWLVRAYILDRMAGMGDITRRPPLDDTVESIEDVRVLEYTPATGGDPTPSAPDLTLVVADVVFTVRRRDGRSAQHFATVTLYPYSGPPGYWTPDALDTLPVAETLGTHGLGLFRARLTAAVSHTACNRVVLEDR